MRVRRVAVALVLSRLSSPRPQRCRESYVAVFLVRDFPFDFLLRGEYVARLSLLSSHLCRSFCFAIVTPSCAELSCIKWNSLRLLTQSNKSSTLFSKSSTRHSRHNYEKSYLPVFVIIISVPSSLNLSHKSFVSR